MSPVLINIAAILLIGLIIWWFWIAKPKASRAGEAPIDILVENGVYTPARIEIPAGKTVILRFTRKDASPCAEKVLFEKQDLAHDLPLNKPKEVRIRIDEAGEYPFTCQMKMYRGSLVVYP